MMLYFNGLMRIGFGYDVHRFATGRRLILGGVEIPHEKGLDGHSDADVLLHAVIDALLGAGGLGDIGRHFPPTDPAYKDISSLELLRRAKGLLGAKGFSIINIDSTIVAQAPRMKGHIPAMIERIASGLDTRPENINVKATTEEGLGFTGSGEGIAAYAVALIAKKGPK